MERTLLLLRHAKSDWRDQGWKNDFDRPLNKRGKQNALELGQYFLKSSDRLPNLVLCSPAKRAKQTWKRVFSQGAYVQPKTVFVDRIYDASSEQLADILRAQSNNYMRIMLIGHNPGLDDLLLYLSASEPGYSKKGKLLTTCALAILQFSEGWEQLKKSGLYLKEIIRPHQSASNPIK